MQLRRCRGWPGAAVANRRDQVNLVDTEGGGRNLEPIPVSAEQHDPATWTSKRDARSRAAVVPAASTTTSYPSPTTMHAPNCSPAERWWSYLATRSTRAPVASAARTAHRPIVPDPMIATRSVPVTRPRRTACTPTASGSMRQRLEARRRTESHDGGLGHEAGLSHATVPANPEDHRHARYAQVIVAIATPWASAARRQRLHGDRRTIGQPTGELVTKCDGELHLHEVEVSGTDACAGHSNQHPVATRTRNMSGDRSTISDAYRSHVETLTAPTALKTDGVRTRDACSAWRGPGRRRRSDPRRSRGQPVGRTAATRRR